MELSRAVTRYFATELAQLGYPVDNIQWSLGHCQGDGMAFYGTLNNAEAETLVRRVCPAGTLATLEEIVTRTLVAAQLEGDPEELASFGGGPDMCVEITPNGYGHHYSHYNTMAVRFAWDSTPVYVFEAYWADEEFRTLTAALDTAIQEDVRATSRRLAEEGYALLDACDAHTIAHDHGDSSAEPWPGRTPSSDMHAVLERHAIGNYTVTIDALDGETMVYESGELEEDHAAAKRMVAGEIVQYVVQAIVWERDTDVELGRSMAYGVTDRVADGLSRDVRVEAVRDAILDAFPERATRYAERRARRARVLRHPPVHHTPVRRSVIHTTFHHRTPQ